MPPPPNSGYLIVKTFERLYREFSKPWDGPGHFYGIPKKGVPASRRKKRYRGIDRDALEHHSDEDERTFGDLIAPRIEPAAQRLLAELEEAGKAADDFIRLLDDALEVFSLLERRQGFELIWAKNYLCDAEQPPASELLGFEPTWFGGDHFSAIADCLFFPRWHGPDKNGTLFTSYYESLNENGLFATAKEAFDYLDFYRSFDWTEKGRYTITEVRLQPIPG